MQKFVNVLQVATLMNTQVQHTGNGPMEFFGYYVRGIEDCF